MATTTTSAEHFAVELDDPTVVATAVAGAITDPASAASVALRAALVAPLARRGGPIVYLGDSITANGAVIPNGVNQYTSTKGPTVWAQMLSGHAYKSVNSGVAGDRTDQMLARFATDVAAYSPAAVHIEGGTNDAVQSVSAATIITNLTALIGQSQALGAAVLVSGIPPRNALTAPQMVVRNTVNRWLADNARVLGFVYINVDQVLTDPASSTQQWLTDLASDGTHPTVLGALAWGRLIAARIKAMVPPSDIIVPGFPYDPKLLSVNPLQIGTGGTMGTGITGSLSASWSANPLNGTVTAAASKVARTDGISGEWQQFAVSAQSVATAGVRQQISATSGFTAGADQVYGFAEFQLGSDLTTASQLSVNITTVAPGFAPVQNNEGMSANGAGLSTAGQYQKLAALLNGMTGVIVTPPITVDPTATASVNLELRFMGLGTVRWGRAGVMKV